MSRIRILVLLAIAGPLFALTNAVYLTDQSGSTQTSRSITIPRYFANQEICGYPQPFMSGSGLTNWQADVKTRWPADVFCPGGWVQYAFVSFELTINANTQVTVEFRGNSNPCSSGDATACTNAGLTKTQMLNFDAGGGAGSWGAGFTYTANGTSVICKVGSTIPCGARDMITNNHYQYLERGPLRTSILVREGPGAVSNVTTRTTSVGLKCVDADDSTKPCLPPYTGFAYKKSDLTLPSISVSSNVATATIVNTPGISRQGQTITVSGVTTDSDLNGTFTIASKSSTTATTFTFNVSNVTNGTYTDSAMQIAFPSATWTDTCPNTEASTGCYRSIRPSYVVTFYPRWGRVETDYLLDNSWMDRIQDQMFNALVFYKDATETATACYTAPAKFVFSAKTRVAQTCWSTTPGRTKIDFNRPYLIYSKVVPAYGANLSMTAGGVAGQVTDYQTTGTGYSGSNIVYVANQGAIVTTQSSPERGRGQWPRLAGAGGGGGTELALLALPYAQHVISQDSDLYDQVLGNARAWGSAIWFLENNGSGVYYSTYDSTKAFGKPPSINYQTGMMTTFAAGPVTTPAGNAPTPSCTTNDCYVWGTSAQSGDDTAWYVNRPGGANKWLNWAQDLAHCNGPHMYPYLVTGKFDILEGLQQHASWLLLAGGTTQVSGGTSRAGAMGFITGTGNDLRRWAWPLRNLADAALLSWDATPEKAYFSNKLNNNIAMVEGRLNITDGGFPPSSTDCTGYNFSTETDPWRFGRCDPYYANQQSDTLALLSRGDNASCDVGVNDNNLLSCKSPWMAAYYKTVTAHVRDIGYSLISSVDNAVSRFFLHYILDSTKPWTPAEAMAMYRMASEKDDSSMLNTWALVGARWRGGSVLATSITGADGTIKVVGSMGLGLQDHGEPNFSGENGSHVMVGSEVMWIPTSAGSSNSVYSKTCTVDAANNVMTCSGHGLTNGEGVMVQGYPYDSGISGAVSCIYDKCWPFYVKQSSLDATNKLEFYRDTALTQRVTLTGSSATNPTLFQSSFPVTRGVFGPAGSHSPGETFVKAGIRLADINALDPTGAHGPYFTTSLSTAVDYDVSDNDEGTGKLITARRAYEAINNALYYQNNWNDNNMWGIRPRPLIRNVRVRPSTTSVTFLYNAPDGNACTVAVSTTAFASTDSSGDTSDAQSKLGRSTTVSSLTTATTYYYRITCGPGTGGSARVWGTFTTQ